MHSAIGHSLYPLPYRQHSAHWFACVRDLGAPVWLDSAWPYSQRGRFDIISAAPLRLLTDRDIGDVLSTVRDQLKFLAPDEAADLPFQGGAIVLLGYEYGRRQHGLNADHSSVLPAALAGIYSWAVVSDHQRQTTTLVVHPQTPPALHDELRRRLLGPTTASNDEAQAFALTSKWQDDFPEPMYAAAFNRLQDYIHAGDCYQVNLARRLHASYQGDPFAAYLRLREIAAAPYSAYFEYRDERDQPRSVLCLSPERFIAAAGNQLMTQPIKGTAPRATDSAQDRELAERLQRSEKNRAENLMIVDLLRNDLGRCCKPGSIHVDQLFELQSFATVHHLVSTIRGELRDDMDALDALQKSFPGGSITGAPKLRAMQIIDELEPHARSIFCGSIGYIDISGRMDTNIAIRTLLATQHDLYAWAGGGIVADSNCTEELEETQHKIASLLNALLSAN